MERLADFTRSRPKQVYLAKKGTKLTTSPVAALRAASFRI